MKNNHINAFLDSFIYSGKEPEDIVYDICKSINEELQKRFVNSMEKRQSSTSLSSSPDYQNLVKQENSLEKIWSIWSNKTLR